MIVAEYAIRFELPNNLLTWWGKAYGNEELLHAIAKCIEKYPTATVQVTKMRDVEINKDKE